MSQQRSNTIIFYDSDKIWAFVRMLDLFISHVSKKDLSACETLNKFWADNEIQPKSNSTLEHIRPLKLNILKYFSEDNSEM